MGCEGNFEPAVKFECIMEIVKEVRSGSVSVLTVQKGLNVLGCALALIPRNNPVGPFGESHLSEYVQSRSVEQICDELETICTQPIYDSVGESDERSVKEPSTAIDISTIMLIAKLVFELLKNLK